MGDGQDEFTWAPRWFTSLPTVTHPITNSAWRQLTSLIGYNVLNTTPNHQIDYKTYTQPQQFGPSILSPAASSTLFQQRTYRLRRSEPLSCPSAGPLRRASRPKSRPGRRSTWPGRRLGTTGRCRSSWGWWRRAVGRCWCLVGGPAHRWHGTRQSVRCAGAGAVLASVVARRMCSRHWLPPIAARR